MNERLIKLADFVPCDAEDAYQTLMAKAVKQISLDPTFNADDRARFDYEMAIVKKCGLAKVFLFGYFLKQVSGGTTISAESCSIINYILKISPVNPARYGLPFSRFFYETKQFLPTYSFYVERGKKAEMLNKLYEKFGLNSVVRGKDNWNVYFVSSEPIKSEIIEKTITVDGETPYQENISALEYTTLGDMGIYSFAVCEMDTIAYSEKTDFTGAQILEKYRDLFGHVAKIIPAVDEEIMAIPYVRESIADTDNKLIFQEQITHLIHKVCDFDWAKAEEFRRALSKRKRSYKAELTKTLTQKYGELGARLAQFIAGCSAYSACKAYVICNLCATITPKTT